MPALLYGCYICGGPMAPGREEFPSGELRFIHRGGSPPNPSEEVQKMKRSIALLLTVLLTVSAYPATAEVTASETNVFFESTEIVPAQLDKVTQIPAGTEYTVLRTLDGADESLAWSQAWTEDYRMAQIRYQSEEGEKTGWITVEAKAHPWTCSRSSTVSTARSSPSPAARWGEAA